MTRNHTTNEDTTMTPQTQTITLELIHDKAQALRTEAQYLEQLERELRQAVAEPQAQAQAQVHVNLRQAVTEVLLSAPDHRLKRSEIIARVRQKLGQHIRPIGIVSTLAAREVFRKVDGDSFVLRNGGEQQAKA